MKKSQITNNGMIEVSKEELWEFVKDRKDATVSNSGSIGGKYPYTTYWKTRGGMLLGKSVPQAKEFEVIPIPYKHYISKI